MGAIAFTYDIATAVGQVRFYAGDTDGAGLNRSGGDRTRTDAEILFLLAQNGNETRSAAAELLEGKASEYAQVATKSEQGMLKQDLTARCRQCLEAAQALRQHPGNPLLHTSAEKVFTMAGTDGTSGSMDGW